MLNKCRYDVVTIGFVIPYLGVLAAGDNHCTGDCVRNVVLPLQALFFSHPQCNEGLHEAHIQETYLWGRHHEAMLA